MYVALFNSVDLGFPITEFTGGILWGLVWGVVLLIIAMVIWVNIVLGMAPDRRQMRTMVVAHLAYGLPLGILGAAIPHLA